MNDCINKKFDVYLKNWAYITKNSFNLPSIRDYIHSNYENTNKFLQNSFIFDKQLQFYIVELALLELEELHREVITLRYIHKLNWDFVSIKINFSRRTCFYLRKDVLNKIQEIQNNKSLPLNTK